MVLNDAPLSIEKDKHQKWKDENLGKPKKKTKTKAPSFEERMKSTIKRLSEGELIRRTRNTYAWDKTGASVTKGTFDTLKSFGHVEPDPSSTLFAEDADRTAQLWRWTGKEWE